MRNLRSYFKVIFDTPKVGDDSLRKFAEVHLQRLAANNPEGVFTILITDLTAVYEDYFGAIADEDVKAALQKSLTQTMNAALEAFQKTARRREGTVRGEFGEGSAEYTEFFPRGLTEYTDATLATAPTVMTRLVTVATKHAARLGQPLVDEFTALRDTFVAARTAQLHAIGGVKGDKQATRTNRDAVEDQLMENLLTLAIRFKRAPDAGMAYFDQSIIRQPDDREGDEVEEGAS